jgi:hypothetical protein
MHLCFFFLIMSDLDFERTTGWKINSNYETIPNHIQIYLENYYNDYNQLLFQYLKKNFTDLW